MRLIDADRLINEFEDTVGSHIAMTRLKLQVQNQPTIDAVEVVRCRDCKEFEKKRHPVFAGYCKEFDSYMADDDFCSCGERR